MNGGIIMEEGNVNFSKELDQKVKEHQAVLLKYPKNIRQIGEIGDGQRIYVEDYVMTYAAYLGSKAKDSYRSAILLGQKAVVEGRRTLFISGAVEIPQQWKQDLSITGEQWTVIYDQMQKYFQDIEIVGWFLTHPGMELEVSEQIQTVWRSGFDGTDKVLFLYENISREDAFYTCKEGEFKRQEGYYIYYEKNEEMQNYIIDEKGGKSTDDGYQDITSKKIRKKIEEKNKINIKYLHHQQFAYSVGILASAVVLVTAATKLYNNASEEAMADLTDVPSIFKDNSWILSKNENQIGENQIDGNQMDENQLDENQSEKKEQKGNGENGQAVNTNQEQQEKNGDKKGNKDNEGKEEQGTKPENKDGTNQGTETKNGEEQGTKPESKDSENQGIDPKNDQEQGTVSEANEGKNSTEKNGENTESETSETKQDAEPASSDNANNAKNNSQGKKKRYTVKKGDTLESISISCYGTSKYVKKIKKINKLENADKIYIGQKLILP